MCSGVVFSFIGKENRVLQRRTAVENDAYVKVHFEMESRDEDLEGQTAVRERGLATDKVT
ncbi:hypothetical protein CPB85DRAFT_1312365 [Mucidula mucida]|nr:hypothetical protein CPB85DRAFT_1312365 [Mucidula mucida]